jgi:hypothetical protein
MCSTHKNRPTLLPVDYFNLNQWLNMKGIGKGPKGEYRFCGGIVKGIDIEGFLGIEEADEMVSYTLHFFLGDFIGEDVGGAVDLHGVAIDDLAVQGFGKVDAELGLADSSCTCALEAIEKEGKQVPTIAHRVFLVIDASIRHTLQILKFRSG